MPFNIAEARLKDIKRLQAQLKELKQKYELECFPRKGKKTHTIDAHSHNKCMKDLMDLTEENLKLRKEVKEWKQACGEAEDRLDEEMKLNEELKEEAEQNKELFDTTFGEFMKLKEENKKVKETLDEVRLEIMHHNGLNRKTFRELSPCWQDIAEAVDYINQHQRIKSLWSKRYDSSSEEED